MNDFFIQSLAKTLQHPLPGEAAQLLMATGMRNIFQPKEKPAEAAVMILLYPRTEGLSLVLIRRSVNNGPHSGQISLPGGKKESNDIDLNDTVLRETQEELGIDTRSISMIGKLTPLFISVSNYRVFPFVGYTRETPRYQPDPVEINYLIEVRLDTLLNPESVSSKVVDYKGKQWTIPFYRIKQEEIWGATAMILSEFLEVCRWATPSSSQK